MSSNSKRFPRVLKKGLVNAVETLASPEIKSRWSVYLIGSLLVIVLGLTIAIFAMLPLKEYVPYFLAERDDGSVAVSSKVGKQFIASSANKSYFLKKYVDGLLTIDEQTKFKLPDTVNFIKGAAIPQWRSFVNQVDRPLYKLALDPSLRREIFYETDIQYLGGDAYSGTAVAWIRVKTIEGGETRNRRVRFTMDYATLPITDASTLNINPIGIYITNFRMENVK